MYPSLGVAEGTGMAKMAVAPGTAATYIWSSGWWEMVHWTWLGRVSASYANSTACCCAITIGTQLPSEYPVCSRHAPQPQLLGNPRLHPLPTHHPHAPCKLVPAWYSGMCMDSYCTPLPTDFRYPISCALVMRGVSAGRATARSSCVNGGAQAGGGLGRDGGELLVEGGC